MSETEDACTELARQLRETEAERDTARALLAATEQQLEIKSALLESECASRLSAIRGAVREALEDERAENHADSISTLAALEVKVARAVTALREAAECEDDKEVLGLVDAALEALR
jgi:metal-responsive CopG/Arc/MetJ family transcriptional regulator